MTQSTVEIAENFVKLWDVASPPGLAEKSYAPDYIEHNPLPGQGPGTAGLDRLAASYFTVFPDLHTRVDAVLRDGDYTVVRWSGQGTHEGDQMGVPPTHRSVNFSGIDILRTADGKIVEHWGETNGLDVMQQMQGG